MRRFEGKEVAITGGASGIGAAMVRGFAAEGARVRVCDLDRERGESLAEEVGGEFAGCDVSKGEAVRDLFVDRCPDVLVNNAGVAHIGTVGDTTEADMDRLFAINIKGVYHPLHVVVPAMAERGTGVVLNMCSIAARVALAQRFAYSMSKGAVLSMTLSVARDYLGQGVRCNALCPARVHTPFVDDYLARTYPGQEEEMFRKLSEAQPVGRMAKPEEIAHLATYICSEDAAFVTGALWDIDGGYMNLR